MENVITNYELLGYFVELIMAELLFLHGFDKRRLFALRFIIATVLGMIICTLLGFQWAYRPTLLKFICLLVVISISVLDMYMCFQARLELIISASIAGVATQHIANKMVNIVRILLFGPHDAYNLDLWPLVLSEVATLVIIYTIIYFLFARNYGAVSNDFRSLLISFVIVIMCIGVNRLVADHNISNIYYEMATSIYAILCCFFSLTIQFYIYKWHEEKSESIIIKNLLDASEKQYEQWKSMEEFTSIKIHDLKHMLDRVERISKEDNVAIPDLEPIRKSIEGFKPQVKTGNEVIDILLRNMVSLCLQQDIRFNCVSYTDMLGNFDSMSLYFLFANAIDNAREAADKVESADKRVVDLSLKQFGDSIVIHIWNYFDGDISYEDKLPTSNKSEVGHGYGLKSIMTIVDSFEGVMSTDVDGDCFHLNIILPL
ncbi:MAG: GHKL domain-containing protein [Lachnospiraceae bacterium]|nr:GHKL domain-containing protein [Lachnospiraceae bacterium]